MVQKAILLSAKTLIFLLMSPFLVLTLNFTQSISSRWVQGSCYYILIEIHNVELGGFYSRLAWANDIRHLLQLTNNY